MPSPPQACTLSKLCALIGSTVSSACIGMRPRAKGDTQTICHMARDFEIFSESRADLVIEGRVQAPAQPRLWKNMLESATAAAAAATASLCWLGGTWLAPCQRMPSGSGPSNVASLDCCRLTHPRN